MGILGILCVLGGLGLGAGLLMNLLPEPMLAFVTLEQDTLILSALTLIVMGVILLVGRAILTTQSSLQEGLNSIPAELRNLEEKVDALQISAKHSIQEFAPEDKVEEYNGYEIYYKNRFFYIRDVNAKFFTLEGAESWIDRTEKLRPNSESYRM